MDTRYDATAQGHAVPVTTPLLVGGYRVCQILPGVAVLGVSAVESAGAGVGRCWSRPAPAHSGLGSDYLARATDSTKAA
ncbi:MAG TPA: hypothetical protein VFC03_16565 [Acidimicrobiales bacterium]|nr:hypothetical protein [Acidimicrobiales bacterium]